MANITRLVKGKIVTIPSDGIRLVNEDWIIRVPGVTYSQDGFQFINDDGTEITATDLAAEDTNITRDKALNTRLRIQIDTTLGAPPSVQNTLQYKEVGDSGSEWRDVPLT